MNARTSDWYQSSQSGASAAADVSASATAALHGSTHPAGSADKLEAALLVSLMWRSCSAAFWQFWASIETRRAAQKSRTLRVVETVAMGEKRFVAIVEVQQERFLIGGGTAGVSLLAKLDASQQFATVLHEQEDGQKASSSSLAAHRIREAW